MNSNIQCIKSVCCKFIASDDQRRGSAMQYDTVSPYCFNPPATATAAATAIATATSTPALPLAMAVGVAVAVAS